MSEIDKVIEFEESSKKVFKILQEAWPDNTTKVSTIDEYKALYRARFAEKSLLFTEEFSEQAEKILEEFDGKETERTCEKILRDPVFEEIIGNMINEKIPPDSFVLLITDIDLLTKIGTLKASAKFLEVIGRFVGKKVGFENAILWLLAQIKEN